MASSSNTAKDRSKELTNHGQPLSHEGKDLSSKFLPEASIIAHVKLTQNTLNVTVANCSMILVSQSNKERVRRNHCCDQCRLQCENSRKEPDSDDCIEQRKRVTEKVECQQQVFGKGEVRSDSGPKGANFILNQTAKGVVDYQVQPLSATQNSKHADSGEIIITSFELPMAPIKVEGDLSGKHGLCERLLEKLEVYQDNGHFDEHDSLVTRAMHFYEGEKNADMLLVLEIERAAPLSYKGQWKLARKKLISVAKSDLKSRASYSDIITARAYYLLAAHMRRNERYRNSKFPLLLEFLRRSEYLLQNYDSPEDLSELYQTYGALWLDRMSQIPNARRNALARNAAREKSKYYFTKAIYFSQQDYRPRVRIKRQMYAHLKLATILLDSCSTFALAQEKPIPPSDIEEAGEHLEIIQFKLGGSIPKATLMLLFKTQSDQLNRQGRFHLAKERAEDAYQLACVHQFNTELETLRERINFLNNKLQTPDQIVIEGHDHASSDTGYNNSGSHSQ